MSAGLLACAVAGGLWETAPGLGKGRDERMGRESDQTAAPGALSLLVRVNALSAWRRFKSLGEQSRLLTAVIVAFIASYLVLAYGLFTIGLVFISRFPGLGSVITERLMFLLFGFLFILLLLSNLVIGYTNFFRNRETAFLLTLPIRRATIFQWKFIESLLLASWAFLFLIAPLLGAYGRTRGVAWHYYVVTFAMVGVFIVLPGVLGAFVAVSIARFLDRRLFQALMLVLVLGLIGASAWWFGPEPAAAELEETRVLAVLDKLLWKTWVAEYPLLPSYWLSSGVLQWADGALFGAGFFMLVLLSYVLFLGTLAFTRMGNLFYEAASAVQSRGRVFARWGWFRTRQEKLDPGRYAPGLAERLVAHARWLAPDVRAVVLKDMRMFWRDTTQWAQSLVLFALLGVYIFNLRHFSQQLTSPFWAHLVSYLNLGACSLNLATLTTRFVYPQFSLEGKRLWIVGLAPLGLERIIKIKFALAVSASLTITLGLISMSCYMLQMGWGQTLFFGGAVTVMTFTLTGLATGLGVLYPNFKEENPSKIVSGFGGTFCLVLSFLYILASVVLLAFSGPWLATAGHLSRERIVYVGMFLGLSAVLGWVPFRLGIRRVRTVEL